MPKFTTIEFIKSNPREYEKMLLKRGKPTKILKEFLSADEEYRKFLLKINEKRHELNKLSKEFSEAKDKNMLRKKVEKVKKELQEIEEKFKALEEERKRAILKLPNLISDDTPEGYGEEHNRPIRYFGRPKVFEGHLKNFLAENKTIYEKISWQVKGHAEILEEILKKADTFQAGRVSKARFYYIFDEICMLDFAISLFAINFLTKKRYRLLIPPYALRKEILQSAMDFEAFKDMIYKIQDEDLYLIGTAEHSLLGLYKGRVIEEDQLPIKLVGWSPCFRKEAGAHGKDTKGIFRVHQFHKVEQFIFSKPEFEEGEKLHEEITKNSEELFKKLEIPFRIVNICAGELGDPAYKKYDLEAWFPAQGKYRELCSASNCLDWQSYRGNLVFRDKRTGKMVHPFTLNNTALATSRTICAILENFQQEDGSVKIPKVLRKYLDVFDNAPKDVILPAK